MSLEIFTSINEQQTIKLGEKFASTLVNGDIVSFYGELGFGKTKFIQGICKKLKVKEIVSSPTYTLINEYNGLNNHKDKVLISHIDLYRINNQNELSEIGFEDIINDLQSIKLIEWAEKSSNLLEFSNYIIEFQIAEDKETRNIKIIKL
ncbi:MAG: tRNA (adenosine(37)-N6)-threonylcarbamoyltransferase complex ATPase subunit type 1 TsaE [Chlorobiota bacterium]|nr:tRNA (adenosine(37)-N6)-threonylcarbamoyltransferase complex ATPase subunit type 1 TsaE [Chlorobiota bacterium]QQS67445.1 MAG: tRNA (adenosine(37)-N6)-threonylcarbamoyltransferase complex ATPase subunit type 1 TsaE [Chlorobiota bacterium]